MARSEETMSLRYDRLLYDGRIVNGREWEVVAAVTLSLRGRGLSRCRVG
jgi:hypothetical protein